MWPTLASFLLKFALKEGLLKWQDVQREADLEKKAREQDEELKNWAIQDLRVAQNGSADEAEAALDRFVERVHP